MTKMLESPKPNLAALIRSGLWFRSLPSDLQQRLLAAAFVRPLAVGERLFAKGDPPDGLYGVAEGGVRITTLAPSGKEALLAIVEAPQWFGEIALFDGQARTHDAWGELPSTLLHVSQASLLALLSAQPVYWHSLGLLLAQKLRLTFSVLEEAALLPAAERLARRLVTMAEGYGDGRDATRREIRLPQDQLGLMLSLSRQTTNQILKQLQAEGAIRLARGGIEILDLDCLKRLCLAQESRRGGSGSGAETNTAGPR